MNLFITVPIQGNPLDGTIKPKEDIVTILHKIDFQSIGILRYDWRKNDWTNVVFRIAGSVDQVRSGDVVVHQFPTYLGYKYENEFLRRIQIRGAKIIGMIHDIDFLRVQNEGNKAGTLEALKKMSLLILTSEKLKLFLQNEGLTMPMIVRGPWDYQKEAKNVVKKFSRSLTIAGYLSPTHTGYLEDLSQKIPIKLFGRQPKVLKIPATVDYRGGVESAILPLYLDEGFGLVWNSDGQKETPSGFYAEYMSYTWLHKFSLYISSGLPVVVPAGTPMAEFVSKYQLGIVIESLSQLPERLAQCTAADYQHFCQQANYVGDLMQRGYFTMEVVIRALTLLGEA